MRQALSLLNQGDEAGAYTALIEDVRENESDSDAWSEMGKALTAERKFPLSVVCHRKSVSINPTGPNLMLYGQALTHENQLDEADLIYKAASVLMPGNSLLWYSMAYRELMAGHPEKSLILSSRAVVLSPDIPDIRWLESHAHLSLGQWKDGFSRHDARLRLKPVPLSSPLWEGQSLEGKTLHVMCEQGFGDVIQFIRFLPLVPCKKIIVTVPEELLRLIKHSIGGYELYGHNEINIKADYCIPLCSIPKEWFNGTLWSNKYLAAPSGPYLRRPKNTKIAVGIAWKGDTRHPVLMRRTAELKDFICELALPGVVLYSLQVGQNDEDPAMLGKMGIVNDMSPVISDFGSTAALIEQLDCVVTIDTAVAHLCGALGHPGHVILPYGASDWRWMHDGAVSPWYPSLTLWRQTKNKTWRDVLNSVAIHLKKEWNL